MAEITKVTTPMIPKENTANRMKPVTDQAFELTDPSKVHKSELEGKATDRQSEANLLRDSMGRPAIAPLLKNTNEMMQVFKKIAMLVETGVSASDAAKDASVKELLESLFITKNDFGKVLMEQEKASVLFKGEAFDVLRDVKEKFGNNPKVRDALANLLKAFDYNVNAQNSVKTILYNCTNILDYMFSKDRAQFTNYLLDLARMLLPQEEAEAFENLRQQPQNTQGQQQAQNAQGQQHAQNAQGQQQTQNAQGQQQTQNAQGQQQTQNAQGQQPPQGTQGQQQPQSTQGQQLPQGAQGEQQPQGAQGQQPPQTTAQAPLPQQAQPQAQGQTAQQMPGAGVDNTNPQQQNVSAQQSSQAQSAPMQQLDEKGTAQVLKNNLLPLLGEIVVKYHQNEKIRDTVMVVVHNIVRVDQGTSDSLRDAVAKLVNELKQVADNIPPKFERQLLEAIKADAVDIKNTPNSVIAKLASVVSEALTSQNTNPAVMRQAENMLISMLQNQSSLMDVLHFVFPLQTPQGQMFTELYVDPETDEKVGKYKGKSHKIFISVESEAHGAFELSFLETGEHVDFAMWCPENLVHSLSGLKKQCSAIMQMHGYTMNNFSVEHLKTPHSVAEVFPRLLERKVGIDVQV